MGWSDNLDSETVAGFGDEWTLFDQSGLPEAERQRLFDLYFNVFRWDLIGAHSVGFDFGCGSGRWAYLLAQKVGHLHCVDASPKALAVAQTNLRRLNNVSFHESGGFAASQTMDFGISLGVLHHVPDTERAVRDCIEMLKIGGTLLLYLYYRFDNRPAWFRWIWSVSDIARRFISKLPFRARWIVTSGIAVLVYLPMAGLAAMLEHLGLNVDNFPLAGYRRLSFYTMRTDALDRFGTRLERRFTRSEIGKMLERSGCEDIRFSDKEPYWCVSAVRFR